MSPISRDQFLKLIAAGGATFLGLNADLLGQDTAKGPLVPWGRLKFTAENGDHEDWHVHPNGDLNLIDSIRDQTSVNLEKKWNVANISDLKSMIAYPFLFMHAEMAPILSDSDRQNLREYLLRGGFLFAEDCVCGYLNHGANTQNDFFFRAMQAELSVIIPGAKLEPLPLSHPIFHCFYHLDAWPHMQGYRHGPWGLTYNGRLISLLSPSDLHCGWTNGDTWFGAGKQMQAMQMGTNIYVYAMTQLGGALPA